MKKRGKKENEKYGNQLNFFLAYSLHSKSLLFIKDESALKAFFHLLLIKQCIQVRNLFI
jgi:hypothetical protein